jgi:hypothetical protein
MVFLMLRDRLGKQAFEQGIRDFWAAQRFKVAAWEDLQRAFENASGEKLGPFFAAWLDQPALPDIAIAEATVQPVSTADRASDRAPDRTPISALGERYLLTIDFRKQAARLPLRLPIEISGGGEREIRWVELGADRHAATIALAFLPQTLRLDPEMRVWRRLDPGQLPPILRQWVAAPSPQLANVASGPEARQAVDQLAGRFFEKAPAALAPGRLAGALNEKSPVLLAGTHAEVDQALRDAGLPARPASLSGQGSAQVWTVPGKAAPLAVISARDAAALGALQRGLPHYGGQSWLVFEQGRVIDKGIWPAAIPEIAVTGPVRKAMK